MSLSFWIVDRGHRVGYFWVDACKASHARLLLHHCCRPFEQCADPSGSVQGKIGTTCSHPGLLS